MPRNGWLADIRLHTDGAINQRTGAEIQVRAAQSHLSCPVDGFLFSFLLLLLLVPFPFPFLLFFFLDFGCRNVSSVGAVGRRACPRPCWGGSKPCCLHSIREVGCSGGGCSNVTPSVFPPLPFLAFCRHRATTTLIVKAYVKIFQ